MPSAPTMTTGLAEAPAPRLCQGWMISAALGLEARFVHPVGAQRRTPKGTLLPGTYPDTRWRHVRRYETTGQWVKDRIAELVEYLEPHRAYLAKLRDSGGRACVILAFLGDGYFGDTIPRSLLERLAELGLDLGIECFTDRQNEYPVGSPDE